MKRIGTALVATALALLTIAGCDHSTNNQDPPEGSDFAIESPKPQTLVEGSVTITVRAASIMPTLIEFYVDGNLIGTRTEQPWQYSWNAFDAPPNSYHTIKARAYSSNNSYKTTQDVVVKVK
jgi:hypothetical protein